MRCIYCLNKKTEVSNSRSTKNGLITWRRRACLSCGFIFTTKETPNADNLFVLKRNGKRERFIYEKLLISIFNSLNIRKYADNGEGAKISKKIADSIIKDLFSLKNKDVKTKTIIQMVYTKLRSIGKVYADHYMYYSDYRQSIIIKDFKK